MVRALSVLKRGNYGPLDRLTKAFADRRPAAVLVGQSASSSSYLIDQFLDTVADDVTVARVSEPCSSPEAALRALLEALRIDPGQHDMETLEGKAERFLSLRRKHGLRTIICFECSQEIEPWAVDRVRRLVELESREKFGLMVILAGRPSLGTLLTRAPFDIIGSCAGQQIVASPFNADETRDYISREARRAGYEHISEVFDLSAITVIHELCAGDIEKIDSLACESIEIAEDLGVSPITTTVVRVAYDRIHKAIAGQHKKNGRDVEQKVGSSHPATGRLIVRINDKAVEEHLVGQGHVLIGRADLCDVVVNNLGVSRHHALVIQSPSGIGLLDLGSKNGTYVDGRRVNQHVLQNGDLIGVGDCTITYFAGSRG
jgi:type II secretory pathway predicted ATPase ExeA